MKLNEPVLVLGHRGMLGRTVRRYFEEKGYIVRTIDARYDSKRPDEFLTNVAACEAGVVVNCIGAIKQKVADANVLFAINSVFPLQLRSALKRETILIHASSDCVFAGNRGSYRSDAYPDCTDSYGLSKALGEVVQLHSPSWVIRTSVIGLEEETSWGLLSWLLTKVGGRVDGFANHFWNGVTTLEWAKCAEEILLGHVPPTVPGTFLLQVGTNEIYSKFELLKLISEIWECPVQIQPKVCDVAIDRSLIPTWPRKLLREQLLELRAWERKQLDTVVCE